jgi:hypothetical protein
MSDDAGSPASARGSAPATLVDVSLLQIPVPVWARTQEHIDELLRECTLIAAQLRERPENAGAVPVRLIELVEELTQDYGGMNIDQENRLASAAEEGVAKLDLVYHVPPSAAEAARRLQEMLDEVDAYCLAGEHLLTMATPPELVRFRHWMLDQFVDQLGGAAPTPFPEYAEK